MRQQPLKHMNVALLHRILQGCLATAPPSIPVGAQFEQQFYFVDVAQLNSQQKRGSLPDIPCFKITVCRY